MYENNESTTPAMQVMLDEDNSKDLDCIREYTHDTAHYAKKISKNLEEDKCNMGHNGSNVAEIIAARDRGDNNDGMGFGGGLGGVLLGGILAGGFGFNRRDDNDGLGAGVANLIQDNANGRFTSLSDQITAGAAASVAATHNASQLEATRDVGSEVCAGFLQTANGFAQTRLDTCNGFGITNSNLKEGFGMVALENCKTAGITNANIAESRFANLLGQKDLAMQLAECCCEMKTTTIEQAQGIKDLINCNTIKGLEQQNEKLFLELSQCRQTAELNDLKNDIRRQGDTVIAIGNTLTSVVNAVNSLVAR